MLARLVQPLAILVPTQTTTLDLYKQLKSCETRYKFASPCRAEKLGKYLRELRLRRRKKHKTVQNLTAKPVSYAMAKSLNYGKCQISILVLSISKYFRTRRREVKKINSFCVFNLPLLPAHRLSSSHPTKLAQCKYTLESDRILATSFSGYHIGVEVGVLHVCCKNCNPHKWSFCYWCAQWR